MRRSVNPDIAPVGAISGLISLLLTLSVTAGGLATLGWATDGWTTWTAESARRRAVLDRHTPLPDIHVQHETGMFSSLHDFDKPILVVDFIFTRCTTVCMVMGYQFSQLQKLLASTGHAENIQFLSISFDHEYDGPKELSAYLNRFSSEAGNWSALRITERQTLDVLLNSLGVIVLPEPELGYVHNAALYLVKDHQVVGIYDVDNTAGLMEHLTSLI